MMNKAKLKRMMVMQILLCLLLASVLLNACIIEPLNDDPKSLTITGIPNDYFGKDLAIDLYDNKDNTIASSYLLTGISDSSILFDLYEPDFQTLWTGTGSYYVLLIIEDIWGTFYYRSNHTVLFNEQNKSMSFSNFKFINSDNIEYLGDISGTITITNIPDWVEEMLICVNDDDYFWNYSELLEFDGLSAATVSWSVPVYDQDGFIWGADYFIDLEYGFYNQDWEFEWEWFPLIEQTITELPCNVGHLEIDFAEMSGFASVLNKTNNFVYRANRSTRLEFNSLR